MSIDFRSPTRENSRQIMNAISEASMNMKTAIMARQSFKVARTSPLRTGSGMWRGIVNLDPIPYAKAPAISAGGFANVCLRSVKQAIVKGIVEVDAGQGGVAAYHDGALSPTSSTMS